MNKKTIIVSGMLLLIAVVAGGAWYLTKTSHPDNSVEYEKQFWGNVKVQ